MPDDAAAPSGPRSGWPLAVVGSSNLRGTEVDTEDIDPEVFTSVNTLYEAFFRAA